MGFLGSSFDDVVHRAHDQTNITLTSLDLSWNSVRMDSAAALGRSLAHNRALVELRLAHNCLADAGTQAVGNSEHVAVGCPADL